jgi:SPP1 gp7 family putative phage head morphogenesis protein
MAKPNDEYWAERAEYVRDFALKNAEDYANELAKRYAAAYRKIQKEIEAFYGRYAKENKISFDEAQRLLTSAERKAHQMDLKEYLKKGRTLGYSDEYLEQLKRASLIYRVSRLQMLQNQIREVIEGLHAEFDTGLQGTSEKVYEDAYYRTVYEIAVGAGVQLDFAKLDTKTVENAITKPWAPDGRQFSERIWTDRTRLVNWLETELTQQFIRNEDPRKIARQLAKDLPQRVGDQFDKALKNAQRLVLTESGHFANAATMKSYENLGVDEYEVLVSLDERTCPICGPMDGKVFATADQIPGVNTPVFHPKCRCTTIPHFDDLEEFAGQRATRDEDGKYKLISGKTTYTQWKAENDINSR